MGRLSRAVAAALLAAVVPATIALAQPGGAGGDDTMRGIERYREQLAEDNPAELWEARGEALWKEKRGPLAASLERCDLGLGPGVVKGAYVALPRFFPDTGKVQDLESRLVGCIVSLQGFPREDVVRQPFGAGSERKSDLEALAAWIASESRGMRIAAPRAHPEERRMIEIGRQIFFHRAGTHDFACATCHSGEDKRIRLQELPRLSTPEGARAAYGTWPGYRVSQGELRTMQHRLWDCFRQQRFPEPAYASDAITALIAYLASNAEGGEYKGPTQKR